MNDGKYDTICCKPCFYICNHNRYSKNKSKWINFTDILARTTTLAALNGLAITGYVILLSQVVDFLGTVIDDKKDDKQASYDLYYSNYPTAHEFIAENTINEEPSHPEPQSSYSSYRRSDDIQLQDIQYR